MHQYRQGDLLFEEIREIPPGARRSDSKVLAYGEVTGHTHMLVGSYTRYDAEDETYVRSDGCGVVHDEHGEIPLKAGRNYKVTRQREYDPLTSIPRQVID